MHSDLLERSRTIRSGIHAPAFPLDAIRIAASRPEPPARRAPLVATVVAGCSVVAIAAAAQVVQQTHLRFMPSGGMVIGSDKLTSRSIHSDDEIRAASAHLDFPAIPPAGLPEDATPMKIDMAGTSLLTITYALPHSHHVWIFLANPKAISGSLLPATSPRRSGRYRTQLWQTGGEKVLVVSDGLTQSQIASIKRAMVREAGT